MSKSEDQKSQPSPQREVTEAPVTPARTTRVGSTHLEFALNYLYDAWFPPTTEVLTRIKTRLTATKGTVVEEALISEIKKDFSLFTYLVKQLSVHAGPTSALEPDPFQRIRRAGVDQLRKMLKVTPSNISHHTLTADETAKTKRLAQPIISATVAEELAPKFGVNKESAYACALFRQIGLALIAWNYPHVYSRGVAGVGVGQSIDATLSKSLGFSPTMLGISIAREWRVDSAIRIAMGDQVEAGMADETTRQNAAHLKHICELGEAMARASDPDFYPKASGSWKTASEEIKKLLGDDGFHALWEKVEQSCEPYLRVMPQLVRAPIGSTADTLRPQRRAPAGLRRGNPYLRHCSKKLSTGLQRYYDALSAKAPASELLVQLAQTIVPMAGFDEGCIFLIEPERMSLVPRLAIGKSKLERFHVITYERGSHAVRSALATPVLAAYRSKTPVMEDDYHIDGKITTYIAGALGESRLAGVLYVELDPDALQRHDANPLVYFRAVRHALEDCLESY